MRELYLILPLLVFVFSGLLLLAVIRGKFWDPLDRMFAFTIFAMGMWGLTIYGVRSSEGLDTAITWERLALISVLAFSLFFYHFTQMFTRQSGPKVLLPLAYTAAIAASVLVASGLVVPEIQQKWYGYAPRFGPLFMLYLGLVSALGFLGIRNLVNLYRSPPSQAYRNRTAYLLLGVGCSFLGVIFDSFPPLMTKYPVGMAGNLLFIAFTAVAIMNHKLLDIRIDIEKSFVILVVSAAILGTYVTLLISFNLLFHHSAFAPSWLGSLTAILGVALLLKPVLDGVQRVADRWFGRSRHDYLHVLGSLSQETKDITNLNQLATVLEKAVTLAMGTKEARLLVPSVNGNRFTSVNDRDSRDFHTVKLLANSPIVNWLCSHDDVLSREDMQTEPVFLSLSGQERVQLEEFQVQLLIPLREREELVGILVLAPKRSGKPYTEEDLDLLRAAANQTAMGLANARLFATVASHRARLEQLLERVIRTQEDERKRLSMELHDSPVQQLTSAVYRLEACLEFFRRGQHMESWSELEAVQMALDQTLQELRHTTAGMHPPELEKVGLVKALDRYASKFEHDTGVLTRFQERGSVPRLSATAELAVYRVVQEALSNVRKHSQATEVAIEVGAFGSGIKAIVRDNGTGFDVDDGRRTEDGHLGLAGMEERARMLGGSLDIQSVQGIGTQITLEIQQMRTNKSFNEPKETVMGAHTEMRPGYEVQI